MSNSSTSRYESENRRYQRTAQTMTSGSKCRHLNSAGRGLIMRYTAAYQTRSLSFCNTAVRLLVFGSSSQIWAQLHEKAFRRLGGVARVIVLDNLREGVRIPDFHDPTVNPLYRDMLRHYNIVPLPCRV